MADRRVSILLIEDNEACADIVRQAFESKREHFDLVVVPNLRKAKRQLSVSFPDVLIVDLNCIDGRSTDLLVSSVRTNIPMITMISNNDEKHIAEAMKTGVHNRVVKSEKNLMDLPYFVDRVLQEWDSNNDRHESEKATYENEEKFRNIVERANDGIAIVQNGVFKYVNPSLKRMGEFKVGEKAGTFDNEHVVSDEPTDGIYRSKKQMTGKDVPRVTEMILKQKDGADLFAELNTKPISYDGKPASLILVRDVTPQKFAEMTSRKVEEALYESEERFRTIVETAPSLLSITDRNGKFMYVSPNCEEITGFTQEDLLDRSLPWIHEDESTRAGEVFDLTLCCNMSGGKDFEYRAVKKNGGEWYASSSWEPFKDNRGSFVGVLFQTVDITERRMVEERMKSSLKEKEVLLREIHHRVKNNLQIISSLLSLQSRYIEDEYAHTMFQESIHRIRSMALVHEKLYDAEDFGKIDLTDYFNRLARDLYRSYRIDPRLIKLNVHVEDISFPIDLAVPCGLIVNELVSNVLKHAFPPSWEGRGKIGISIRLNEDGEVELSVKDNGVGIPKDLDVRKTKSLGLKLVTVLVEDQLCGKIRLDVRKGTKFLIRFKMEK